jgi:putative nucleotidyltransferase with HDIG domain
MRSDRDRLQTLAARLQAARQALLIYPPRHPQLEQVMTEAFDELEAFIGGSPEAKIAVASDEFVVDHTQVPAEGEILSELAILLRALGVEKIIFRRGVRRWEFNLFIRTLGKEPSEVIAAGGFESVLRDAEVAHIDVGAIVASAAPGEPDAGAVFNTWETYGWGLQIIEAIKSSSRSRGELGDVSGVRDLAYRLTQLAIQETRALLAVHSLMEHDEYSFTHSINVAMLTVGIAQSLGFDKEELHEIAVAALLHDVGKETIPGEILRKPGKLDDDEWKIVNRHGVEGARMLSRTEGVGDLAPIVAYEHHLAYHPELRDDPDWVPHFASQIVCLADVYDALRSNRPYRDGLPPDRCMEIMKADSGKKFDPLLFDGFYRMMGVYPPGTVVELSDGTVAVALRNDPQHPETPRVVRIRDANGEPLKPVVVDLADGSVHETVTQVLDPDDVGVEPIDYV